MGLPSVPHAILSDNVLTTLQIGGMRMSWAKHLKTLCGDFRIPGMRALKQKDHASEGRGPMKASFFGHVKPRETP